MRLDRRTIWVICILIGALLCAVGAADVLAGALGLSAIDTSAAETIRNIALRAGAAFAVAKTINAGLSFVQEISVSGSIVFASGTVHPASFLDPVNNLVDQFALAMLLVAAAAALIGLLTHMGASLGLSVFAAAGLALLAASLALGPTYGRRARPLWRLAVAAFSIAFLLRLALPAALAFSGAISDHLLAEPYEVAQAELQNVEDIVERTASESTEEGWFDNAAGKAARAFAGIGDRFDNLFESVVTMIAIFVIETVILPLALLWVLYRTFRLVSGVD